VPRGEKGYFKDRLEPMVDSKQIQLIGDVKDRTKEQFLANAAALLFPVDWPEPFGLVMIEAIPNEFDRAHGRTGSSVMVHGDCASAGCYAMTDEQISEIYAIARESFFGGQRAFQVQAYPFRMTPANLAKHRDNPNMPFWHMLKDGNDHFEVTRLEPKVDVCESRYVFDAEVPASVRQGSFNPIGTCPLTRSGARSLPPLPRNKGKIGSRRRSSSPTGRQPCTSEAG